MTGTPSNGRGPARAASGRVGYNRRLMLQRVVLDIPALHCEGCVASVSYALSTFTGIHDIEGDLMRKTLTVSYDLGSITPVAMKRQLEAIGYPVADSRDA